MSHLQRPQQHAIERAKYFPAAPTYHKWVKLTAADVHALHEEPGYEGQNLYFYLNHPIQYVYLVAPIVAIEDTHRKFTIITLDDSSGSCIDVKVERKDDANVEPGCANTDVGNLNIASTLGTFELRIDGQAVDIGTVVKAKCTIGSFRDVRQLVLKRVSIIQDTSEEVAAWAAMAQFKRDVLSRPWVLKDEERAALEKQLQEERQHGLEEERKERRRTRAHREREAQREERRRQHDERTEQRRRAAEEKFNYGALI